MGHPPNQDSSKGLSVLFLFLGVGLAGWGAWGLISRNILHDYGIHSATGYLWRYYGFGLFVVGGWLIKTGWSGLQKKK